jgi:hypothetical protein
MASAALATLWRLSLVTGTRLWPQWLRGHAVESIAAVLLAGYFLAWSLVRFGNPRHFAVRRLARVLDRIDVASVRVLDRGFLTAFAALAALWLCTWLPHYLYWPWCRDVDTFAVMAQAWATGERPYRDIRAFNFPGHIYLHWILGKLFGWGHPGAFYAVDAAILLTLGISALAWSRRCSGRLLPGMASYLIFLGYYLGAHFEIVAERDWHASLCSVWAIFALQGWPGRRARFVSALLAAAAFTIRPQVVLFLPALALAAMNSDHPAAVDQAPCDARSGLNRRAKLLLEWLGLLLCCLLAGFAPILVSGLIGDMIQGLRIVAYGGPYSDATPARRLAMLIDEVRDLRTLGLLISLVALTALSRCRALRVMARAWLIALLGALLYRPLSPVAHNYLKTPLELVRALAWSIPMIWIIREAAEKRRFGFGSFPAVLMLALIVYEGLPALFPHNCSVRASLDSIVAAVRRGWPKLPPGAQVWYSPRIQNNYAWGGYCHLLDYVRAKTGPETIVANVLRQPPFPSVNGPTGRRSPFHVESGIAWMYVVNQDLESQFVRELENSGCDSVVVWSPAEDQRYLRLPLARLTEVIRRHYRPEARFGKIEVWRRNCAAEGQRAVARLGIEEFP